MQYLGNTPIVLVQKSSLFLMAQTQHKFLDGFIKLKMHHFQNYLRFSGLRQALRERRGCDPQLSDVRVRVHPAGRPLHRNADGQGTLGVSGAVLVRK